MQRNKPGRIAPLMALAAAIIAVPAAAQTAGVPNFIIGYSLQPLNNAIRLTDGATIAFPPTQIGSTATGTLIIGNLGTAAGAVNSVMISGGAFNTENLPLLPVAVGSGAELTVPLIYTPGALGTDSGTLTIAAGGQTTTVNLAGTGIAAQFQFQVTANGQTTSVNPLGVIPVPDTAIGATTNVSVTITNSSGTAGTINAINISGAGYQIIGTLPLPFTLLPSGSATMAFSFTPAQPGPAVGSLTIGSTVFSLAGRGLGPVYRYSYTSGAASGPVSSGGTIFFPQAQVGQNSTNTFTISNSGTAAGTIAGIFLNAQNSQFSLGSLPAFPLTLAPGDTASFQITFTPGTTGGQQSTLSIDGAQFTLAGSASAPPAFPSYSLTGPSGNVSTLQQVPVTLSIVAPYSLPVQGTLTLAVLPQGFSADPAIQFSTGGKTVAFTIPANGTSAVFANGSNTVKLQTGSTAGTITLTPTFQTSGGAALTTGGGSPLQLNVPAAAPAIVGAQITAVTPTGITVAVTGLADTQNLSHIDFQFTPASGYSLKTTSMSVPVSAAAAAFFGSAAAQNFGGQFVATVPFNLTLGSTVSSALNLIKSISITATNDQGTSSAFSLNLQ